MKGLIESSGTARESIERIAEAVGNLLVDGFHYLALFAIGASIVWSAATAFLGMVGKGYANIEDILLLFIYLELGAMVGIYFKTLHMPVRFLIYVCITAITRELMVLVSTGKPPDYDHLILAGAILILAAAGLVVRYASFTFPARPGDASARAAPE